MQQAPFAAGRSRAPPARSRPCTPHTRPSTATAARAPGWPTLPSRCDIGAARMIESSRASAMGELTRLLTFGLVAVKVLCVRRFQVHCWAGTCGRSIE